MEKTRPDLTITYADPDGLDGSPQDVALAAAEDYERVLRELVGFAERVEVHVLNAAMQDYEEHHDLLDEVLGNNAYNYAQGTRELSLVARANGALAVAQDKADELRQTLEAPLLGRD